MQSKESRVLPLRELTIYIDGQLKRSFLTNFREWYVYVSDYGYFCLETNLTHFAFNPLSVIAVYGQKRMSCEVLCSILQLVVKGAALR